MPGAIGNAIGTLYGSSPPRGLVHVLSGGCIILGVTRCYQAYSKLHDERPFHIRDLFQTIWTPPRLGGPTRPQLWIEGILGIALGIALLVVFK
jgi:hypothetical protein